MLHPKQLHLLTVQGYTTGILETYTRALTSLGVATFKYVTICYQCFNSISILRFQLVISTYNLNPNCFQLSAQCKSYKTVNLKCF